MNGRLPDAVQGILLAGIVAVVVFLIVAGLRAQGHLQRPEMAHYDWMLARTADPAPARDVIVVSVDDADLQRWGWPLSDGRLADIIEALLSAGAAVIGLDIYRDQAVMEGGQRLESAFLGADAVWVTKLDDRGGLGIEGPAFAQATGDVGFADMPVDADGVVRRGILLVSGAEGMSLAFSTQLALRAIGQDGLRAWPDDPRVLLFGKTPVPRLEDGFGSYRGLDDLGYQVLVGYPNRLPMAQSVPARDLLSGRADAALIKGKVVLVGVTSESIKDNFRTPLNTAPGTPFSYGVQVHAALTQQLLDHASGQSTPIRSPGRIAHLAMILAAAAGGALAGLASQSALAAALAGPGLTVALAWSLSMLLPRGIWLPVVPVSAAWLAAFVITFLAIGIMSRRQRRAIARLFADHLSPELSAEIWNARDVILAGGKPLPRRLRVSVLLADLAGSTTVGGTSEPGAFMDWASRLLDDMSRVCRENGGFIEKFTGDGILVIFGAPLPRTTEAEFRKDATSACRAALQISALVDGLNAGDGLLAPYRVRIGLHCGPVLGGTLGSAGRLQYNVMGDTVNVAARIEAFGKTLTARHSANTTICASAEMVTLAGSEFAFKPTGELLHDDKSHRFELFLLVGSAAQEAAR